VESAGNPARDRAGRSDSHRVSRAGAGLGVRGVVRRRSVPLGNDSSGRSRFSFGPIGHFLCVTEPAQTPKRLYRKAARGKDESAPLIVISGVMLVVAVAVGLLLTAAFLVYFLV